MPRFKNRPGIIPLIALIIVGIAVLVGGTYIVRKEFTKTEKSGKIGLDEKKVEEQIQKPETLPTFTPTPKVEQPVGPFAYKPTPPPSASTSLPEPSFSISGPSGWTRSSTKGVERARFDAPEPDVEPAEDGLILRVTPVLAVEFYRSDITAPKQAADAARSNPDQTLQNITVVSESETTISGQPAYFVDFTGTFQGSPIHSYDYFLVKNGYIIHIGGTGLESGWGNHSASIKSAVSTFTFSD